MKKIITILLYIATVIIMMTGCTQGESEWDRRPMVMIDDIIYLDTNNEVPVEVNDTDIVGTIISSVDGSELPTGNNQSNFGCEGSEYAYYENGIIININEKWILFEKEAN